jgi:flagellar hook assembly protein FlgD
MGQALPGDNNWNFNGTLDEVRIYDYMLPVSQISTLYDVETGIDKTSAGSLPKEFFLDQNYPNPFNPSTVIRFSIPAKLDRTNVRLEIFDLLGRNIDTLIDGEMSEGYHSILWNAARFPSGIYYCRLMTSLGTQVRKMILMR